MKIMHCIDWFNFVTSILLLPLLLITHSDLRVTPFFKHLSLKLRAGGRGGGQEKMLIKITINRIFGIHLELQRLFLQLWQIKNANNFVQHRAQYETPSLKHHAMPYHAMPSILETTEYGGFEDVHGE